MGKHTRPPRARSVEPLGDAYWDGPVWDEFGLSYASYFVAPRALLCAMPRAWQERFVACLRELNETFHGYEPPKGYRVFGMRANGTNMVDPLSDYRHPNVDTIRALRSPRQ